MPIVKRRSSSRKIELTGSVGIADAAELHAQLCPLLARKSKVTLDLGAVERLDTAVAQVLVGFAMAAQRGEVPLVWNAASEAALASLRSIGLLEHSGLAGAQAD